MRLKPNIELFLVSLLFEFILEANWMACCCEVDFEAYPKSLNKIFRPNMMLFCG